MNQKNPRLPGELFTGERPPLTMKEKLMGLPGCLLFIVVFIGGILVATAIVVLPMLALMGGL